MYLFRKTKLIAKSIFLFLAFGIMLISFDTHATVVPFAKRSQRLLYSATSTQFDIEINKDGISFKYNFSGNNAIAVQNYCGFWLSVCQDSGWIGVSDVPSLTDTL